MMQFTETPPQPLHQIVTTPPFSPNLPIMNKNQTHRTRPWPGFPTSSKLTNFGDANCMEQLLVHCANAIETNDATLAQQILWVLNNIAPPDGDSNQRLACAFLRALIARAARSGSLKLLAAMNAAQANLAIHTHKFSVIELAGFIDLTPWHRFGFTAANSVILEAVEGYSVIHIVDLSLTHCMQIPTLVDAIASRQDGLTTPPLLKLTVAGTTEDVPPMLDLSYEELGSKLVNFARSRNIILEFRVIPSSYTDGFANLIEQLRVQNLVYPESGHEALVINCHMMLHYIPEETFQNFEPCSSSSTSITTSSSSLRSMFLKAVRGLDPTVVVVVDEDADLTSNDLVGRLRSAFNYLWIPYDTIDTFLPRGSKQRQWYEADMCWKIENVIAYEGFQRVERLEPKCRWVQRMRSAGFRSVSFGVEAVNEVKAMLDEHAAGWGLKREEEDLVLTWKGHNVVFATAWMLA
ncbi:putative transcription factor GRAS family [Rosa chinensis]|uniref:Putative transcription factor GRAS family n=1 Tax=Rosa chinensis TaxID=74649 RepID=A0A2P6RNY8_ROSCH|nr:scarecrow-like protein 32 [Rosa chinensis]PRQ48155.1 putative transcription factor GRAS family [Rosa chinensis]